MAAFVADTIPIFVAITITIDQDCGKYTCCHPKHGENDACFKALSVTLFAGDAVLTSPGVSPPVSIPRHDRAFTGFGHQVAATLGRIGAQCGVFDTATGDAMVDIRLFRLRCAIVPFNHHNFDWVSRCCRNCVFRRSILPAG